MLELPENYSPKYRGRVYYANSCNLCFSSENLLKCASCLAVSYCSKEHQMRDWSFHKPTCIALKKIKSVIPFPKTHHPEQFLRYRRSLMECLAMHRQLIDSSQLTKYEREICSIPWVCSICFKKPSSNFECNVCRSVAYCSAEHKKEDEVDHENFCWKLRIRKLLVTWCNDDSLKPKIKTYIYRKIKHGYKQWPLSTFELFKLIHNVNEEQFPYIPENYVSACIFLDPYIPAATILNALDSAGFVKNRRFISNSPRSQWNPKRQRKIKYGPPKKSNLIIHFAISDDYELNLRWVEVAQLISDWLLNVDNVEIVLTGSMLKSCVIPTFESRDKLAGVTVHKMAYEEIEHLSIPDVVVMFECQRSLKPKIGLFWDDHHIDCLFDHPGVPLILASGDSKSFTKIGEILTSCINVEMLVNMSYNPFTDMNEERDWEEHIRVYSRNFFYGVFTRHDY